VRLPPRARRTGRPIAPSVICRAGAAASPVTGDPTGDRLAISLMPAGPGRGDLGEVTIHGHDRPAERKNQCNT
jgi:hypothetical protein